MCIQEPNLDDNYESLISKLQEMHRPMKKFEITKRKKIGSLKFSQGKKYPEEICTKKRKKGKGR
jgi:hypothetical protein